MIFLKIPLLFLTALYTWTAYNESKAHARYQPTISRFITALIIPLLWVVGIIFLPVERWILTVVQLLTPIFLGIDWIPIIGIVMIFGATLVSTIGLWVEASLCGDTQEWFRERINKIIGKNT